MKHENITILFNSYWGDGKSISGGDQMLLQIFKRIGKHFNEIVCYTNVNGKKLIAKNDIEITRFNISFSVFDIFPVIIAYVCRTIQSLKLAFYKNTDIIYSGADLFPDVIPAFLHKVLRPKTKWIQCIFHIYPDWRVRPGNKVRNFVAQYLQKFSLILIKRSDVIININSQVKTELVKLGFSENRIIVNTPGIDAEYLQNLAIPQNTNKYDGTFLARLDPSKGIFDLIEIWKIVTEIEPKMTLAILGDGSKETIIHLRKQIIKAKLEKNIFLLGFLENDEAFSIIKNSKVFLFPSHEEGFGIAIAEAMACGVAVVAWDLPVYQEIFEDKIIQVKKGDLIKFAESVVELIGNDTIRLRMLNNGIIQAKKYSWDSIASKHLHILKNL
jgi:glycosyltransferase involved in cell wall biosynthesis